MSISTHTGSSKGLILTLNAGSSSLKFALFSDAAAPVRVLEGSIDRIGSPTSTFTLSDLASEQTEQEQVSAFDHESCLDDLLKRLLKMTGAADFDAVGHRVVHGLDRYEQPEVVTAEMIDELRNIIPFAPEHLPAEIALIDVLRRRFPKLLQVACFDTAFHRDMPGVARFIPIPRSFEAAGVRRYGFHGLSYEFIMDELERLNDPAATKGRVILAHLGNGASLAAVRDGKSIDTSMGFTPAGGVMMSTRSGDLDPGVVSFLMRSEGMTASQFDEMANHESGLLGVSNSSSDMRDLLARQPDDAYAAEAVELFCYQVKKWIGSFAAALGGLDTLVFSGGIGENAPLIRDRICDGLGFLGIELDEAQNAVSGPLVSNKTGRVAVRVIHTDEELMIVKSVCRVLGPSLTGKE